MRSNDIGRPAAMLATAALAFAAACGGKESQQAAGEKGREIQLAPSGKAEPKLNDVPAKGSSGGMLGFLRRTGTIDAGASIAVHPTARVCTNTNRTGSVVAARVSESVRGSNGALIPAGSAVQLRVTESARSENSKDNVKLAFDPMSLTVAGESYAVNAAVTGMSKLELVRVQSTTTQAEKIGAGAAIGAIAGQVLGKNTPSTVAGAAVGAAAGTAVAVATADYDGCLPSSGTITIKLSAPLKIKVGTKAAT